MEGGDLRSKYDPTLTNQIDKMNPSLAADLSARPVYITAG